MKRWILIIVVMVFILPFCLLACNSQDVPPVAQQIAEKIELAIQNYKENRVPEGAILLCDVVLMTRPLDSWPEGFAGEMDSAKSSFQKADFSDGVGHVTQAIKIFSPDSSLLAQGESGVPGPLAQIILNKLETSIENFKAGDADQAVMKILESLSLLSPIR